MYPFVINGVFLFVYFWYLLYIIFVQVDSANEHGILLEVVQILTDLNLTIRKAYISSDGGWFMDGISRNFPIFSLDMVL